MKQLLAAMASLALIGAGCSPSPVTPTSQPPTSQIPTQPPAPPREVTRIGDVLTIAKILKPDGQPDESLIDQAKFTKRGFIVIHAMDHEKVGAIVAHSEIQSVGDHTDIPVVGKLTPGMPYMAMLHADNGDNKFDPKKDTEHLKDANGMDIMATFQFAPEASEPNSATSTK